MDLELGQPPHGTEKLTFRQSLTVDSPRSFRKAENRLGLEGEQFLEINPRAESLACMTFWFMVGKMMN